MRTFAQKPNATQQTAAHRSPIPGRGHPEVRSILHLQRAIGNRAVQRVLQTKLAINEPGDSYEQDADRIAEQVMQPGREHEAVQTKRVEAGDTGHDEAPPTVHGVLRSPGQPLDPATRAFMEPRFGQDFSRVRVHTGAAAEESARDVNALAYTVGHDVVFGAGRFAPGTQEGRRLIAHELAHTVQQSGGAPAAVARTPKQPPFAVNQQDMVSLQNTMLKFYGLLSAAERASLQRNTTVVIALVSHGNQPTLVYTVAGNSTNPGFRAAADQLGLARWDPEGIDKVAGERHAEQLTFEAASKLGFKVHGMAVSREPCPDCGPVVAGKGVPIVWVRDPNPAPRTPGAAGGPPAGGLPPVAPPRQSPAPTQAAPAQPAGTTTTRAEVGPPLKPVSEATPGYRPAKGAAIGAAAQMLQSKMLGNLQQAEVEKFEKRLAELQPHIDSFLSKGYSVQLMLIVEKPKTYDFMCGMGAFCDSSQLTYFHSMFINLVETVNPVMSPPRNTGQASVWAPGGREGFAPYTNQGGGYIDEELVPHLSTRDPLHRCAFEKLTLYPQESVSPLAASRPPALPVKPRPRLDPEARKARALAPSEVYMLLGSMRRSQMADEVQKKLAGNASFGEVKQRMAGLNMTRTVVDYRSDLDKPRAEALAEIVRSVGLPSVWVNLSGSGDGDPGTLQIYFGRDADK